MKKNDSQYNGSRHNYAQLRKALNEVMPWLVEQVGYKGADVGNGTLVVFHAPEMKPSVKKLIATELGDIPLKFEVKL